MGPFDRPGQKAHFRGFAGDYASPCPGRRLKTKAS